MVFLLMFIAISSYFKKLNIFQNLKFYYHSLYKLKPCLLNIFYKQPGFKLQVKYYMVVLDSSFHRHNVLPMKFVLRSCTHLQLSRFLFCF